MVYVIQYYRFYDDNPNSKKRGAWLNHVASKYSALGTANICRNLTRRNRIATRILSNKGIVLATYKFNPPNIVVTTYNSPYFEKEILQEVKDNGESNDNEE